MKLEDKILKFLQSEIRQVRSNEIVLAVGNSRQAVEAALETLLQENLISKVKPFSCKFYVYTAKNQHAILEVQN